MSYGSDKAMEMDFTPQQGNKGDEHLYVKFYYEMRPDKKYEGEGARPMVEVEYYDIRVPGSHDSVAGPVTDTICKRFPLHYKAFKDRVAAPVSGTPLSEWAAINRSMVENLSFVGVKTVEQLAELADSAASNLRGVITFKNKAIAYLEATKDDAVVNRMVEELAERDNMIKALEEKVDALMVTVEQIQQGVIEVKDPKPEIKTVPTEEAKLAPRRRVKIK